MGWLFGWDSRRDLIRHLLREHTNGDCKLLAHQAAGNNLWTVIEHERGRSIVLYMLSGGRGRDWGYKDVSESMGPVYHTCPLAYLDMVPPIEGDTTIEGPARWSSAWRARVRHYWAARNARAAARRARRRAMTLL